MEMSEKIIKQIYIAMLRFDKIYLRDIWQVKILHSGLGDSLLFSCRFRNKQYNSFILSIEIRFKSPQAKIRGSIHLLCPRRIFSKEIFKVEHALLEEETLKGILRQPKYLNYYKMNRALPYGLMIGVFNRYLKEKITHLIDTTQQEKYQWETR